MAANKIFRAAKSQLLKPFYWQDIPFHGRLAKTTKSIDELRRRCESFLADRCHPLGNSNSDQDEVLVGRFLLQVKQKFNRFGTRGNPDLMLIRVSCYCAKVGRSRWPLVDED